uniref:Uncharacterized protein n=1 Tax=Varanus komodoensis TaxID=61221 RepID=A0A8D2J010_VARKO
TESARSLVLAEKQSLGKGGVPRLRKVETYFGSDVRRNEGRLEGFFGLVFETMICGVMTYTEHAERQTVVYGLKRQGRTLNGVQSLKVKYRSKRPLTDHPLTR